MGFLECNGMLWYALEMCAAIKGDKGDTYICVYFVHSETAAHSQKTSVWKLLDIFCVGC